jgi:hypothetical protein
MLVWRGSSLWPVPGAFPLALASYEDHSASLLYLMGCAFEELWVTKPATSKGGNAEV